MATALHISIFNGTAFLWSEGVSPGDIKELRKAVKAVTFDLKILKNNTENQFVWLPTRGDLPIPSTPLLGEEPDKRRKVQFRPFSIAARPLTVEELFEFMAIAERGNIPGSGVLYGNSVPWIRQLLDIALKLAGEESFLPTITGYDSQWEARWVPVPTDEAEVKLQKIIQSMPAVCRCLNNTREIAPETPRQATFEMLLAHSLDFIVRNSIVTERKKKTAHSVHDAWLDALSSEDATIKWSNQSELQSFAQQLSTWRRSVDINTKSQFRFCFRLTEPIVDEEPENWQVEYLLQPKTDQSLHLPVGQLWKKTGQAVNYLKKLGGVPTEFILTALGQASGLCPDIAASLKKKNPGGCDLNAHQALQFLKDYAEALRAAGFMVLLPSWWVGRGPVKRIGLKAKANSPKMQGGGHGLSLNSMIEFDYAVSLGGEELSMAELKSLAKLKAHLVHVRGQWTQIDQEQIKSAIQFLEKQKSGNMTGQELLTLALGAEKQVNGLTMDSIETDGWLNDLMEKLTGHAEFTSLPQPPGFSGTLRQYQERGFSWLAFLKQWGLGACLADDMGLGKTVQALALIQQERGNGEKRPVLLLCPTSVLNNWRKEAQKFTPELSVMVHHGLKRRKKKAFIQNVGQTALVVSSYGLLQRDIEFLKQVDWAGVILDEAQNIKNPETKQSKAVRALCSDYRFALTGTPVENHVGDLWALMDFLNPGLLGAQAAFKRNFHRPIQVYGNENAADRLKTLTGPFILRRLKTDKAIISDLPDKLEMKEYCTLTKEQASLYKAVVDDMQKQIEETEGIKRRGLVLATLMKLKQVCNHPAQFAADNSSVKGRSGKLQRLEEMLTETVELKERTLVFTQFAEMGKMLKNYFQDYFGREVFLIHGGVSKKKRDEMVDRFQNSASAPPLFILSLKAGGTGLTLTRANHVVHFDRWWNPAVENQATDRAFRIGQHKNVLVHKFIVAGTLEERIDEMIENKTGIANQVVGTGEKWLGELSNNELRDLITLGAEAVGE
ncbi:MAG: ATP-dependent helicase [Deltaproteobacteria bacterium]|nr:MAG: ATP-dependent helicase [Deltaproteobacteria bacterium]RLC15374.1 MAG: ATP-dependent helicase [Deltaproteobacteria bacterium]